MVKICWCMALLFSVVARAEGPQSAAGMPDNKTVGTAPSAAAPSTYFARFSYLTSRAGKNDIRSFRSSGSDESGSMSESSSLPNLNYVSAVAFARPFRNQQVMLGGLQSLDPASTRTITALGRSFVLPGEILALRYKYELGERFSLSAGDIYVDTFKFLDPTAGIAYRNMRADGWGQRAGLDFSAPLSARSNAETLVTRGTLRTRLIHRSDVWIMSGGLAYSRPFYSDPSKAGTFGHSSANSAGPRSRPPGGSGGGLSPGGAIGSATTTQSLEEVDLVMLEPEFARTTASAGVLFSPGAKWKLSSNAGATHLETAKGHVIWLTSAKILGASYRLGQAEVGSDFQLYSDAHKFAHPSLPSLWSVGVHLSYSFGVEPTI